MALHLAEALYDFAFAVMMFHATGHAIVGAMVYAVGYTAEIIVNIFAVILDYVNKIFFMLLILMLKIILFSAVWYWYSNSFEIAVWQIICAAFFIDMLHHIWRFSDEVLLFSIFLQRKERQDILGSIGVISGGVKLVGPALAGFTLTFVSHSVDLLLISIGLQVLAYIALCYVSKLIVRPGNKSTNHNSSILFLDTIYTLRQMLQSDLRYPLYLQAIFSTLCALVMLFMFPLLSYDFHISDADIGLLLSCGVAGSIMANIIWRKLTHDIPFNQIICISSMSLVGNIICCIVWPYLTTLALFIPCLYATCTIFFRSSQIFFACYFQERHADRFATYYAAVDLLHRVTALLAIIISGLLFDIIGGKYFYLLISIFSSILSLYIISQQKASMRSRDRQN